MNLALALSNYWSDIGAWMTKKMKISKEPAMLGVIKTKWWLLQQCKLHYIREREWDSLWTTM